MKKGARKCRRKGYKKIHGEIVQLAGHFDRFGNCAKCGRKNVEVTTRCRNGPLCLKCFVPVAVPAPYCVVAARAPRRKAPDRHAYPTMNDSATLERWLLQRETNIAVTLGGLD